MKLINLFFFYLIFTSLLFTESQNIRFERINLQDGLSQSSVHCILQDSMGFMWFGTIDGLNRYDGYSFKTFRYIPWSSKSLSSNRIYSLNEDKTGMIWVGTAGGGLCSYDTKKGEFKHFLHNPQDSLSLSSNYVNIIKIAMELIGLGLVGVD